MRHQIKLQDRFKQSDLDQDKILPPEETVQRFKDKTKAAGLSILDETTRIDNGRLDIPVFFSVCGHDAAHLTGTKKQMGKGATPSQAEASAVMELAERYSFFSFYNRSENFTMDTYENVRDRALDFDLIARSVHDDSDDLAISKKIFEQIPLKWTRGYNLTRQEEVLIPFDWFYTINEFNGASAGNCTEEALSQGICEIVERHVSSIISADKLGVPVLNTDAVTDPFVLDMLAKYKKAGITLHISDFTLDMGIPTVGILAYDPLTFPDKSEIVWTAGTTPDPQKALSRALSETAQLAGDFNTGSNYIASGLPKFQNLAAAGYVINADQKIDLRKLPDLSHGNIKVELESCLSALADRDMQVLAVNTMHPLLQIPAFYSIIPGAHFRERSLGTSVGMFTARLMTENYPPRIAMAELKNMQAKLPGKYYIYFYLGTTCLALGDPETALGYLTKALDFEPTDQDLPSIYSYMGVCLKDMERYHDALDVLQKGVLCDPDRTDLHNLMGFCHFKLKAHAQAIESFKAVVRIDPGSGIDYANIASNYRDMGDASKAIEYYELALEIDPSIEFARDNLKRLKG
jgi:ribosomal protein S12 methylthiotransferase accessory factor